MNFLSEKIATTAGFSSSSHSPVALQEITLSAVQQHLKNVHKLVVSREQLVDNTSVLRLEADARRLRIYEALYIAQKKPKLNGQITGSTRILKLFCSAVVPDNATQGPILYTFLGYFSVVFLGFNRIFRVKVFYHF